eukprot:1185738-Prorocentrum_minimum.AAC.4
MPPARFLGARRGIPCRIGSRVPESAARDETKAAPGLECVSPGPPCEPPPRPLLVQFHGILGSGIHGVVKMVTRKKDGQVFALKSLVKRKLVMSEQTNAVKSEVQILREH